MTEQQTSQSEPDCTSENVGGVLTEWAEPFELVSKTDGKEAPLQVVVTLLSQFPFDERVLPKVLKDSISTIAAYALTTLRIQAAQFQVAFRPAASGPEADAAEPSQEG